MRNISENYLLNLDISLTMQDLSLKRHICIQDIAVAGTVSQVFNIAPSSFFMKY